MIIRAEHGKQTVILKRQGNGHVIGVIGHGVGLVEGRWKKSHFRGFR